MTTEKKAKISTLPVHRRKQMDYRERVESALSGNPVDRIPVCFWHHFKPEGSGKELAEATASFFDTRYDLDILKIMPDIPYPFPRKSVRHRDDLRMIEPINPAASRHLKQRVEAVRYLREMTTGRPIVLTIFSPLCEMLHMVESPEYFHFHAAASAVEMHAALAIVAENIRLSIEAAIAAGADGIFFALQGCTDEVMSESMYCEFGRPYDLMALRGAEEGWLNILHIHGSRDLHFRSVLDYPVQVLSWSDRIAGPSLRDARMLTSKCLMGGWNEFGALSNGPIEQIEAEAKDAVGQSFGIGLILAGGCSVPDETDDQWLLAARQIANDLVLP